MKKKMIGKKVLLGLALTVSVMGVIWGLLGAALVEASGFSQQPTVNVPTVTGTPTGPIAVVVSDPEDQINVRSGPDIIYPKVGILINRQEVPALAKTEGGSWVKIFYPGVEGGVAWVYAPLVRVNQELPIVPKPPTPTPLTTPTIDPTLASQFVAEIPPTRKPTFTPAPALVIPTYENQTIRSRSSEFPMGLVIIGLVAVSVFSFFISLLRES